MRLRSLYDRCCVYVCPDALASSDFELLECCLRDGGAVLLDDPLALGVTHIVCDPSQHARFAPGLRERFYAIVRPEWVFRSFVLQKVLPVDKFSADPRRFFSTLAIAAGSIDKDPRRVIDGLIAHFGGQTVDDASNVGGATHILSPDGTPTEAASIAEQRAFQVSYTEADVIRQVQLWSQWLEERPVSLDFSLPGCLVAHVGKCAGLSETFHVNYAWIEECVRRKSRVGEAAFSRSPAVLTNDDFPSWKSCPDIKLEDMDFTQVASVYLNSSSTSASITGELAAIRKLSPERIAVMQTTLAGAIVLLAQHIPLQLKDPVAEILKAAKAKVANVPLGDSYPEIVRKVVTNASFVVCRYQSGLEYEEALRQKKKVVSPYWVLTGLDSLSDSSGMREALMQPIKSCGGINGMDSLVITLSGFNSRTEPTREDVQMAIQATGACVLPVLSRSHSTHLLCYEAKGEKFKKAQSWNFDNILSPEWLLECIREWGHASETQFRIGSTCRDATNVEIEHGANAGDGNGKESGVPPGEDQLAPVSHEDKTAPSRFDVHEILDELNEPTPKAQQGTRGALKLDAEGAAEVSTKLFDTPGKTTRRRASRASSGDDKQVSVDGSIPDDFEFKFGRKGRPKGKAHPTDKKVLFEEREPDSESSTIKGRRGSKRQSRGAAPETPSECHEDETAVPTSVTRNELEAQGRRKAGESVSAVNTKPVATARKRKSNEPATHSNAVSDIDGHQTISQASSKKKKSEAAVERSPPVAGSNAESSKGRVFLLTGSREECAINESLIISLGGTVSQVPGRIFDPKCTHIITSELKRTEKFVAGCAAGKWILKQSYLDASSAAGKFVDESEHEWGVKEGDINGMDPRIWPPVCGFWRAARSTEPLSKGAFEGWRFLVHPKTVPPADMCERVIAAADGETIPLTSSLDLTALVATSTKQKPVVALVHADLSSRDSWLKKFKASGVRCINASFLIDYLTKDQTNRPRVEEYLL